MLLIMRSLIFAVVLSVIGLTASAQTPTWHLVHSILVDNCAGSGCHSGSQPSFNVNDTRSQVWMDLYNAAPVNPNAANKGERLVFPGQPYQSFLLKKVAHGLGSYATTDLDLEVADGDNMPYGSPALSIVEVELIRQWILAGADSSSNYSTADTSVFSAYYANPVQSFVSQPAAPPVGEGYQIHVGPVFYPPGQEDEYFLTYDPMHDGDKAVNKIDIVANSELMHAGLSTFADSTVAAAFPTGMYLLNPLTAFDSRKDFVWYFRGEGLELPRGSAFYFNEEVRYDLDIHPINYNNEILPVEVYLNVYTDAAGQANNVEMNSLRLNSLNFSVTANSTQRFTSTHNIVNKYLWAVMPYTRLRGTDFDIYQKEANGAQGDQIYEGHYNYSSGFNQGYFDWEHPPMLMQSDTGLLLPYGLIMDVEYTNPSSIRYQFGFTTNDEFMITQALYTDQQFVSGVRVIAAGGLSSPFCNDTVTLAVDGAYVSYQWSTGETSPTIVADQSGQYTVTVTDGLGDTFSSSPYQVIFDSLVVDFSYTATGNTISATAINALYPQDYTWKVDGAVLASGVDQISQLLTSGNTYLFTLVAEDACGNVDSTSNTIYIGNVEGSVFRDDNTNGVQDTLEQGVANERVVITPGPIYGITRADGTFYASVPDGAYTATYTAPNYWDHTTPSTGTINFTVSGGVPSTSIDLGVRPIPGMNDVGVQFIPSTLVSGFTSSSWLIIKNYGNDTLAGTATLELDSLLGLNSSTPSYTSSLGNTYSWNYTGLYPGEERRILLDLQVSVVNFGVPVLCVATVDPIVGDADTTNNTFIYNEPLLGAFDPNDKRVEPGRSNFETLFSEDLDYTIRFQNIGNYKATNIRVEDTLDLNLDVNTLEILSSSHPMEYQITGTHNLTFFFNNINLPDSTTNEPGSHGFVKYSIKPLSGLAENTVIDNTAHIYFDFQEAVVTNTTENKLVSVLTGIAPVAQSDLLVYPNPANNVLYVKGANLTQATSIQVFDLTGKLVLTEAVTTEGIDISELNVGMYIYSISNGGDGGKYGKLLIKR